MHNKSFSKGRNKKLFLWIALFFVLIVAAVFAFYRGSPTGNASFEVEVYNYQQGEPLNGQIKFHLKEGECVPSDSHIFINHGNQSKDFLISELVDDSLIDCDYFAEDSSISGSGQGYGVIGSRVIIPTIDFEIRVFSGEEEIVEESAGEENSGDESEEEVSGGEESGGEIIVEESAGEEIIVEEEGDEEILEETPTEESGGEEIVEEESAEEAPEGDSGGESSDGGDSGITGNAVGEDEYTTSGSVSMENEFNYNLEEGQSAEIVPGSVKINGEEIDDSAIDLEVDGTEVTVSTDYFINEEGFGDEFLSDEFAMTLFIDMDSVGVVAEGESLEVELVQNGVEISSSTQDISVEPAEIPQNDTNQTILVEQTIFQIKNIPTMRTAPQTSIQINLVEYFTGAENYAVSIPDFSADISGEILTLTPNEGFTGARKTTIIASAGEEIFESNEFLILVSSGVIEITTSREQIRLNEPVIWEKTINSEDSNLIVEIPEVATNVAVEGAEITNEVSEVEIGNSEEVVEEGSEEIGGSLLSGNVVTEIDVGEEGLCERFDWCKNTVNSVKEVFENIKSGITGNAVSEDDELISENSDGESELEETKDLVLEKNSDEEIVVSYETPAPTSTEIEIENGKEIVISGPDGLYEDVIAYTEFESNVPVDLKDKISIYWIVPAEEADEQVLAEAAEKTVGEIPEFTIVEESSELEISDSLITGNAVSELRSEVRQKVPFEAYDVDGDENLDYFEWVVPHLSNQTYQIVIEITKAEHLDSNRTLISDIYDEVYALDGNWSEVISENHFVRVTFELNLTSDRDITIYPRTVNGTPRVEIYEVNGNEIVAEFDSLNDNSYNKVYLTNLVGEQDTFDLKILDGEIEIDHIIDPSLLGPNAVTLNAPANDATDVSLSATLDVTPSDPDSTTLNVTFWNRAAPIGTGIFHTCGILANGSAYCWGQGSLGNLGYGGNDTQVNPIAVNQSGGLSNWVAITVGGSTNEKHTCGILANGSAYCWGGGGLGQLGNGGTGNQFNPTAVSAAGGSTTWVALSTGRAYTCGILANGSAYCWGQGSNGKLGYGGTSQQNSPIAVNQSGGLSNWVAITVPGSTTSSHTCGILANGSAYCWGLGTSGQLGQGVNATSVNPIAVNQSGGLSNWVAIAAGNVQTCGIIANGSLYCWGSGGSGRLGYGGTSDQYNPTLVNQSGGLSNWVAVSSGESHTCGIIANGSLYCWGTASDGRLGYGGTSQQNSPIAVNQSGGLSNWTQITAGHSYTCGIIANGSAYCWGASSTAGMLGYGGTSQQNSPIAVNISSVFPNETIKIGENLNVNNGSSTTTTWGGLRQSTTYLWSASAFDDIGVYHSSIWKFATGTGVAPDSSAPLVTINFPVNGTHYNAQYLPLNFNITLNENGSARYSLDDGVNNFTMYNTTGGTIGTLLNATNSSISESTEYVFKVYANDTAGNNNWTTTSVFRIDTRTNDYTITSPANTSYNTVQTSILGTFEIDDGLATPTCWYSLNGGVSNVTFTCVEDVEITGLTSSQGSNTWTLYANDTAGNYNSSSVTFVVDSANPGITYGVRTEPDGIYIRRNNLVVNVSVSDSNFANNTIRLYNSDGILYTNSSTSNPYIVNYTGLSDETYSFNATARDSSNNQNSTTTRNVVIDTTVPLISYGAGVSANGIIQSSGDIFVNLSTSDTNDHYSFTDFDRSNVLWIRFDELASSFYTDLSTYSNNATEDAPIQFKNESGRWGYSRTSNGEDSTYADDVGTSLDFDNTKNYSWSFWVYRTGSSNNIILQKGSLAGLTGYVVELDNSGFVKYQQSAGTTSNLSVPANSWTHVAVTYSNALVKIYVNGTISASATVTPYDSDTSSTLYFGSSSDGSPMSGSLDEILIFNRTLTQAEINSLYSGTNKYSNNFSVGQGNHTFRGYAVDRAGNRNSTEQRSVIVDSVVPIVNLTYPLNTSYSSVITALNYTVSDSNLQACWYSLDLGVTNTSVTCGTNVTGLTSSQGSNTWRVYANDSYGNWNSSSVTFSVDSVVPLVQFVDPTDATLVGSISGYYNRSYILVNVTASDTNLQNILVRLYNFSSGAQINTSSTSSSPNYANFSVADGNYQFNATANDTFGNSNSTATRTVIVDTLVPLVTYYGDTPANGSVTNGIFSVNVSFFSDGGSTIKTYSLFLYNSSGSSLAGSGIEGTSATQQNNSFNVSGLGEGNYYFIASATDKASNTNASRRDIHVDSTTPLISFGTGTPENNSVQGSNSIYVNVSVTETFEDTIMFSLSNGSHSLLNSSSFTNDRRTINWTGLSDGRYYFNVSVNDSVGRFNATETRTVLIDTTGPGLVFAPGTPNNGDFADGGSVYVNTTISESNIGSVVYTLYNSSGTVNSTSFNNENSTINWTGISAGTYFYNVTINDTSGNVNRTSARTITLLNSCLSQCTEGSSCTISSACVLHNGLCTGGICDFGNFVMNANVYTLYDGANARNLDLNLSGNVTFGSGFNFTFNGQNGTDLGSGSVGGNGSVVNITVPGLFNTTSARFVGLGGYTTSASGSGGNGGSLQINYHGLIRKFTDANYDLPNNSPNLTAGRSTSGVNGTNSSIIYNKDLNTLPRDPDIDNDGLISSADIIILQNQYNKVTGETGFTTDRDVTGDGKINIVDFTKVGLKYLTRGD